jgi:hypothetical protein
MWDDTFYTEAGFYWTPSHGFLRFFGADASGGAGAISSAAPYIRVAYQKNYGAQNFEVGAFALIANLYPGGDTSTGTTDTLADIGLDASYQYLGDGEDIYTVNARYTHERQRLAASVALGNAANLSNSLNDARLDVSYTWQNILSGTVQVFNTWGSVDPLLYGGNTALRPDSSGFVLEVDGTLFGHDMDLLDGRFNLRVGAQYTVYTRFDGSSSNYDGSGRNASDNNTLRLFVWTAL